MKLILKGTLPENKKIQRYGCVSCSSVVEAALDEATMHPKTKVKAFLCPICDDHIIANENSIKLAMKLIKEYKEYVRNAEENEFFYDSRTPEDIDFGDEDDESIAMKTRMKKHFPNYGSNDCEGDEWMFMDPENHKSF
jgi:predicted RNA-binding Zn-ribbon protein involved in translation (DUF1610 family)